MSQENIDKLKRYAESININPEYYDIGEQVYDGQAETVLVVYADKEHTQELDYFVIEDREEEYDNDNQ